MQLVPTTYTGMFDSSGCNTMREPSTSNMCQHCGNRRLGSNSNNNNNDTSTDTIIDPSIYNETNIIEDDHDNKINITPFNIAGPKIAQKRKKGKKKYHDERKQ
mmetsp:Transcript_23707/g.23980  ORF Transcript_23707/g.23980 Transcript_23707/m.23980 type:complete len:103 (+) Transcript_23707:151-459(+)